MHPAVELLINRMKSHPEDFKGNSRWLQAFNDYKKHFSKEDLISAEHAYKETRMVQFQGRLFDLMTQEEKPKVIDLGSASVAMSGQPVSYSSGATTATWASQQDEAEFVKKQFELYKATEQIRLEMENEIYNPRL